MTIHMEASLTVAPRPSVRLSVRLSVRSLVPSLRFSRNRKVKETSNLMET